MTQTNIPTIHEMKKLRTDALNKLIEAKFGTERGAKSAAASYLLADLGNITNMCKGVKPIPDRYIIELNKLPDMERSAIENAVKDIFTQSDDYIKRLTFDMDGKSYTQLQQIAKYHNDGKNVDLTEAGNIAKMFSYLITQEFHACGLSASENPLA